MGSIYYTVRLKKKADRKRKTRRRPKSFKSVESAEAWAKANKLKKYHLKNLRLPGSSDMKIQVIAEK
ncbi:hypothetical protein J4410_00125 [Candidatus Woesearchaeota archaeon]|nr:hypothetical protein [Candidatus Woesearchaeota archaeon]